MTAQERDVGSPLRMYPKQGYVEAPLKQTWTRVLGAGNDAPIILQLLQPGQDRMQQDNTEQNEDSQGTVC